MAFFSVMLMNCLFSIVFWIITGVLLLGLVLLIISLVFGTQYHLSKKRELAGGALRKRYKKWISICTGVPETVMVSLIVGVSVYVYNLLVS